MGKSVIVIGGGAAGLMAAYHAAKNENAVTLIEKNQKVGRKIMITGKGRCNVTNNCDNDTFIKNVAVNGRFLYSAISSFTAADTMDFFENAGVPLKTERGNRVFPVSDKSSDIVDALFSTVKKCGVKIVNGTVKKLIKQDERFFIELEDGEVIFADGVIIATGGASYPLTGSNGDGYEFARKLGHTIVPIKPSLVPLEIHEGFCTKLSGLTLKNVTLKVFEEGKEKPVFGELGEMLFTHFGVSGPLVLSASSLMRSVDKTKYFAFIDLKPALDAQTLDKRLQRDLIENSNKDVVNSLDKLLPKSLIPVVLKLADIDERQKSNQMTKEQRNALCGVIKGLKLTVTGFRPIEEAIITSGGVKVQEINPKTMESKIVQGLYFAGEIIDTDAYTGGFNLQIAFSTGALAGKNI